MKAASKMKTISKVKTTSKMKMTWKWRRPQKLALPSKMFFAPLPLKRYLNFFWWLLPMTATPQLMLNRKWYQASKPEMEFHMINMMYRHCPCAHGQKRRDFHAKTTVNWRSTHGAGHIPQCASNMTFVVLVFKKSQRNSSKYCNESSLKMLSEKDNQVPKNIPSRSYQILSGFYFMTKNPKMPE